MTPDQIAAKVILDWNSKHAASDGDAPVSRGAAFGLHELIATALRQARADALEEAAKLIEPDDKPYCSCIEEWRGIWMHHCDCKNGGDQDSAQAWCDGKNAANEIRALKHKDQK